MKQSLATVAIAFILLAFGFAGADDADQAESQMQEWCEMERLYKETRGEAGWPTKRCEEVK